MTNSHGILSIVNDPVTEKLIVLSPSMVRAEHFARFMERSMKDLDVVTQLEQLRGRHFDDLKVVSLDAGSLEDEALWMGALVHRFSDDPVRNYLAAKEKAAKPVRHVYV